VNDETPALSPSIGMTLATASPRDAWWQHRLLGGVEKPPSDETDWGSVLHSLCFPGGKVIRVWQGNDFRSKEARAYRDQAREDGHVPISAPKHEQAKVVAQRILEGVLGFGYDLTAGETEVKVDWMEPSDHGEVLCRGYLDWLSEDRQLILDLKTTRGSVHPDACAAALEKMTGAVQDVAYRRGVEFHSPKLAGRVQCIFLFAQTIAPFSVVPVICGSSMRELGESRWNRAIAIWSQCLAAGREIEHWPSYVNPGDDPAIVEAPRWALTRELEMDY